MKKLILMTLCLLIAMPNSFANEKKMKRKKKSSTEQVERRTMSQGQSFQRQYGMAGCGLGSMVIGKSGGITQIFASTTNGTSANQLFGITSGTLNCIDDASAEVASKMDNFIEMNKVALASDMAQGQGETINALASVMGCNQSDKLGKTLQGNFEAVYPSHNVNTMDVTDKVITVIINDQDLYQSCSSLQVI